MKKFLQLIILISAIGCLSGCMSAARPVAYNPEAVYKGPSLGMWITGLIDADTGKIQGKMFVPPGVFLFTDGSEISEQKGS